MTLGLFLRRAVQAGLSLTDLDSIEYGTVVDIMVEAANDDYEYPEIAEQEDFDLF